MKPHQIERRLTRESKLSGGITPNYHGFGLANIMPTILSHYKAKHNQNILAPEVFDYELLRGAKTVVFLVIDGLGHYQLQHEWKTQDLHTHDALKEGHMSIATSVLPSTTATAMTTLGVGVTPQEHGFLGYSSWLPEHKVIMQMLAWKPLWGKLRQKIQLRKMQPLPTMADRLHRAGVRCTNINRELFMHGSLSNMIRGNMDYVPYSTSADLFVQARKYLSRNAGKKRFLHLYWDMFDHLSHVYGPNGAEAGEEIRMIDMLLHENILRRQWKDTVLVVTADHGHTTINPKQVLRLKKHPTLVRNLAIPPYGEPRFMQLKPKKGKQEAVYEYCEKAFGKHAHVLLQEEALALGLLGINKPAKHVSERLGDILLLPKKNYAFGGGPTQGMTQLIGQHGSISKEEMLVPLMTVRLG